MVQAADFGKLHDLLSITEHPSSRRLSLPHPRGERGDVCGRHWPELLKDKDSRRPPR
jgi:hypothetical protein